MSDFFVVVNIYIKHLVLSVSLIWRENYKYWKTKFFPNSAIVNMLLLYILKFLTITWEKQCLQCLWKLYTQICFKTYIFQFDSPFLFHMHIYHFSRAQHLDMGTGVAQNCQIKLKTETSCFVPYFGRKYF